MKRVICIHGNGDGSGKDNWFPWLKAELEKAGVTVLTPDFPEPHIGPVKLWLPMLETLGANGQTVLVGHSTGAIAAMRYAEAHQLGGSVLVGAYYTDLGYDEEKQSGYFDTPWDWETIRQNQPWIIQFADTADPFIPLAESRYVRDHLSTEYHELAAGNHFGTGAGDQLQFPELLASLKEKLGV